HGFAGGGGGHEAHSWVLRFGSSEVDVIQGRSPQTPHSGLRLNLMARMVMSRESYRMRRPVKAGLSPRRMRRASAACSAPIAPGTGPSTPASAHDGAWASGGGSSSKRQR